MASQDAAAQEEEDLKLAIALSLQKTEEETRAACSDSKSAKSKTSGLLALDRAAIERDRLERKRKARSSPDTANIPSSKIPRGAAETNLGLLPSTDGPCFHTGAVKKTWAFGYPRNDDIKIEEVLQRSDLKLAVLSSFQWNIEWLFSKIDLQSQSKLILVMQANDEAQKRQYRQETADIPNLRLCFPPMPPNTSNMHSKLMLLSHPTYLRIVVPSANLVPYDWGETGHMENSLFLIDLPRLPLPNDQRAEEASLTLFGQELLYFCRAMGLPGAVVDGLLNFDFSATKDYAFVHAIGGMHADESDPWRRTGYCGLGRAVSQLGLSQPLASPLRADFVASSLGSLNNEFLRGLSLALRGDDGTTELSWRNLSARKSLPTIHKQSTVQRSTDHFRVYFPSSETVSRSCGGPNGAGTICFNERSFNSPKFPQEILHDCRSTRKGILMHNKVSGMPAVVCFEVSLPDLQILYVQLTKTNARQREDSHSASVDTSRRLRPWAYVGSANCSESAWGRLTFDRSTKRPKLNCRNWECGILVPTPKTTGDGVELPAGTVETEEPGDEVLTAFEGTIPVPLEMPAPKLGEGGLKPWFFVAGED